MHGLFADDKKYEQKMRLLKSRMLKLFPSYGYL
jgi:hypothetical protein